MLRWPPPRTVFTVASGDLRPSANVKCWPVQEQLEADVARAVESFGWTVVRGHGFDEAAGSRVHRQPAQGAGGVRRRCRRMRRCSWSRRCGSTAITCSPGCARIGGPIMVVANWNGTFPGLVGLLNLTASLTKAGVEYSSLWSVDFTDEWALDGLRTWLETGPAGPRRRPCPRPPGARRVGRRGRARAGAGRAVAPGEGDHRGVRRGLHGDVQRDLRRRVAQPARHLQGAAVAERAGRRDESGQRRRGGGGEGVARRRRVAVRLRHRRGDRADRRRR